MKSIPEILAILAHVGASESMRKNIIQYNEGKLKDAAAGDPTMFNVAGAQIGNCYYNYSDVCINYDGNDASKPNGMCGKVEPYEVEEVLGVKVARFNYSIDSGD